MSYTSRISMSSNEDKDPVYITEKGKELHYGSYWAWETEAEPTWYFRLVCIQDSAGGLHAVIETPTSSAVGVHLPMFDSNQIRAVTDESEIAIAALQLV